MCFTSTKLEDIVADIDYSFSI